MLYSCLVCGYDGLENKQYNGKNTSGEICSCCGFQYGKDDKDNRNSYEEWRKNWIEEGCHFWYIPECPENWDVEKQLKEIDVTYKKSNLIKNNCPVCEFDGLFEPAYDEEYGYPSDDICPCCGFQFGLHDYPEKIKGIKKWRENWILGGCQWHFKPDKPTEWSPKSQLTNLVNLQYESHQ